MNGPNRVLRRHTEYNISSCKLFVTPGQQTLETLVLLSMEISQFRIIDAWFVMSLECLQKKSIAVGLLNSRRRPWLGTMRFTIARIIAVLYLLSSWAYLNCSVWLWFGWVRSLIACCVSDAWKLPYVKCYSLRDNSLWSLFVICTSIETRLSLNIVLSCFS